MFFFCRWLKVFFSGDWNLFFYCNTRFSNLRSHGFLMESVVLVHAASRPIDTCMLVGGPTEFKMREQGNLHCKWVNDRIEADFGVPMAEHPPSHPHNPSLIARMRHPSCPCELVLCSSSCLNISCATAPSW